MKRNLTASLASWVADGFRRIGQILITPLENGGYELRHLADRDRTDLAQHRSPQDARRLSLNDEAGKFRPMKTAPNLRRGWSLTLANAAELREALDYFYPAMTGLWLSHLEGKLQVTPLREMLGRQTGMYAATKRLQDAEGQALVGRACCAASGCLKRVLWPFAPDTPLSELPEEERHAGVTTHADGLREIPMLCQEACNLLVAACREVVKKRERANPLPPAAT